MDIFKLVGLVLYFIDHFLVPLIFAIAFIIFLWGMVQYFIASGDNDEKRETGKKLALYGIIGFAIMMAVWGLVAILINTFGFQGQGRPALPTFGGSNSQYVPAQSAPVFGGGGSQQSSGIGKGGLNSACPVGNECKAGLVCDPTPCDGKCPQCVNP